MKKRYFLLLLLTTFSAQTFSQEYDPIIKESSFWDVMSQGSGACTTASRFAIGNDTLINNTTYKRIKIYTMYDANGASSCFDGPLYIHENDFYYAEEFIRESIEEKKLYILTTEYSSNGQLEESVLCDFNLNVGDTMLNAFGLSDSYLVIQGIDTDSQGRKRYNHGCGNFTEGVGNSIGILKICDLYLDGVSQELFCHGNAENQNDCATVLSTEDFAISTFKMSPNPVGNKLSLTINENSTVKTYSILGQLIDTFQLNTNTEIDVSTYKKGMYLLEISNQQNLKRVLKFIKE